MEGYEYLVCVTPDLFKQFYSDLSLQFWNMDRGTEPDRPVYVTSNRVTLDQLTPNHRYAFKVRSRAKAGYSPWSDVVHASTKTGVGPAGGKLIYGLILQCFT